MITTAALLSSSSVRNITVCSVTVSPGDCALLPAGTGHCRLEASADFLVVGGYPPNQPWNLRREAISEAAKREMAKVPFPNSDPVLGAAGPLGRFWSAAK